MPRLTVYEQNVRSDNRVQATASAADFGGETAQALLGAGKELERTGRVVSAVEDARNRMRAGAALAQDDLAWRQKMIDMQNDPEFAKKYGEDGAGIDGGPSFSDAFKNEFEMFAQERLSTTDAKQKQYIEQGMYNLGESLYGSSMQYQAEVGAAFSVDTLKKAIDNARGSANMSPNQYTSIVANAEMVIDAAPHIDPVTRRRMKEGALEDITIGAALARLERGQAGQVVNGKMSFTYIDSATGEPVTKSLRDIVSEETYGTLKNQAETKIKEAESAAKQVVADKLSDIDAAIDMAETPDDFVSIQRDLEANAPAFTHKQNNEMKVKLYKAQKKLNEDIDSVDRGNAFVTGEAYLNPEDTDGVKDYNNYYSKVIDPQLADMDQDARNTRLVNMVSETKVIPDRLKGDIKVAARSLDVKQVTSAADFMDRLAQTNPHLLQDIPEKDQARINMVNSLLSAGYSEADAFARVDEALAPANAAVLEQRQTVLKEAKVDYQSLALSNFEPSFLRRVFTSAEGLNKKGDIATRQISQVTSDYKKAYDSHFKMTGDDVLAQKHANAVVAGTYGVTGINGKDQLMRFSPEKYFSLPNDSNEWMREQFVSEAKQALAKSATDGGTIDQVFLVPEPTVTSRTAKLGKPYYKMMYYGKDGTPRDLLGPNNYFTFDPTEYKNSKIGKAREMQANNPLDQIPRGIK